MEKSLIRNLLNIYHSPETRFRRNKGLEAFRQEYNIGHIVGASIQFSQQDKSAIRTLLQQLENIDAETTGPDQWDGLSRAASLALGSNEKLTSVNVRDQRVAVKHLSGKYLSLTSQALTLPDGCNLDINWQWLAGNSQHSQVLVVENWEAFELIHQVKLDLSIAGENPLIVFRGSLVYSQDHVVALLEALRQPVTAFVDFDPAGLKLAQSLPHFQDIILPPIPVLESQLRACTNHERYQAQLPQAQQILDSSAHPGICRAWAIVKRYGVALPQETFL